MGTYERYSNFTIEKALYYPKRPNSCEKSRNKASVFTVHQSYFTEIKPINFSNTFQLKQSQALGRQKSGKTLRKIKVFEGSPDKKKLGLRANYMIPDKSIHFNLAKTAIKPLKSEPQFSKQGLLKVIKRSLVTVKKGLSFNLRNL